MATTIRTRDVDGDGKMLVLKTSDVHAAVMARTQSNRVWTISELLADVGLAENTKNIGSVGRIINHLVQTTREMAWRGGLHVRTSLVDEVWFAAEARFSRRTGADTDVLGAAGLDEQYLYGPMFGVEG
jgi:hypothetical protein